MALSPRATIRVYWQHAKRYRWLMLILTVSLIGLNVGDIMMPVLFKRFIDTATTAEPSVIRDALVGVLFLIAAVTAWRFTMFRIAAFTNNQFQPRVMIDLERTGFEYLMQHSYRFFSNAFAGSLVRKVHRLSRGFETFADQIFWRLLNVLITTLGVLIIFGLESPTLILMLSVWIVLFIVVNILFARWKLRYDQKRAALDTESTGVLSDAISNVITIKQFNGFVYERNLFRNVTERLRKMYTFTWNLGEVNDAVQFLLMGILEVVIMYYSIQMYVSGSLSIGTFVLLQTGLVAIFDRLWDFGRVIRHLYESIADGQEMVEILETPIEILDREDAKELEVTNGAIDFDDVTFAYSEKRKILSHFSLAIAAHEKVAFVGPSGAGKSTTVKLLMRFFNVSEGAITIDGTDISTVTQESLRHHVALVPQDTVLFHRSLMENIRYGRRDATDAEVIEAARKAHCHEFISNLANGYGTLVGERGVKLSGGERQRVAIARAILRDAPILVLDEATSSLDSESEALIQDALRELMKGKTVIVIAHRLSTIMMMDRIVVIENGTVSDTGTHEELLTRKGTYAKLWSIQAGGFLP